MANVHIKSDDRRAHEAYVLGSFRKGGEATTTADREAAEVITARTQEAHRELKKMEEKRNG